ncbi:type II toxin-antitoxin system death-on-curing family toxin [Pararhodobacter marinus]|uniref:type II toxin-antitoxin system death-on-curing family toxin n=1 Tax=Pararhodobacter marinus TaxID=2184063 RepID=UPI0035158A48
MRFDLPPDHEIFVPAVEDVHWLHDNVALIEGGLPGITDEGALASALARPLHVAAYSDANPDLIFLAAYLWHGVSEAHSYADGNKRTAVLVMIAFLAANGIEYLAQEDEIGRLVDGWYKGSVFTLDQLDGYLRARCRWAE